MFALQHFQQDMKLKNVVDWASGWSGQGAVFGAMDDEFVLEELGWMEKAMFGGNVVWHGCDYEVKPAVSVYCLKVRVTNGKAMGALLEALRKRWRIWVRMLLWIKHYFALN